MTKLGREKVSIEDLKFVVTKKFQSSKKIDDLDIGTRNRFVKNSMAFDFKSIEFKRERKDTLEFVEIFILVLLTGWQKRGIFFLQMIKKSLGGQKSYDLVTLSLIK